MIFSFLLPEAEEGSGLCQPWCSLSCSMRGFMLDSCTEGGVGGLGLQAGPAENGGRRLLQRLCVQTAQAQVLSASAPAT